LQEVQANGAVAVGGWYTPDVLKRGHVDAGAGAGAGAGEPAGMESPNALADGFRPDPNRGYIIDTAPTADGHVQLLHPVLDEDAEAAFARAGGAAGNEGGVGGAQGGDDEDVSSEDESSGTPMKWMTKKTKKTKDNRGNNTETHPAESTSTSNAGGNYGIGTVQPDGTREVTAPCEQLVGLFNRIDVYGARFRQKFRLEDPTHVRLKLLHACDQCHSSR
jgi:hypothetical protein